MLEAIMKWFRFHQNNSGGEYVIDEQIGIGHEVWVEATDHEEANEKGSSLGLFGLPYCGCCGERFYSALKWDGEDAPKIAESSDWHRSRYGEDITFLHYADGRMVKEVR
jgi:hypothetical protein